MVEINKLYSYERRGKPKVLYEYVYVISDERSRELTENFRRLYRKRYLRPSMGSKLFFVCIRQYYKMFFVTSLEKAIRLQEEYLALGYQPGILEEALTQPQIGFDEQECELIGLSREAAALWINEYKERESV